MPHIKIEKSKLKKKPKTLAEKGKNRFLGNDMKGVGGAGRGRTPGGGAGGWGRATNEASCLGM